MDNGGLIFFAIIIFYSIMESELKKKKRGEQQQASLLPTEEGEWEEEASQHEETGTTRVASETLIPKDIWEEIAGLAEPEDVSDPGTAQFRLFDAYARFLTGAAEEAPLLIVLDDLHWADKPSLLLLQHVARELARLPILIVATYRDTDLVRTHPLSESLAQN